MLKDNTDEIAAELGYELIADEEDICMVSYKKDDVRINIYLTTNTVATCINHPKKGKTQLFRKHVDYNMLKQIFANPRTHTGKGYYTK